MVPTLLKGNIHLDKRGSLIYNNSFNASVIKRIYFIENINSKVIRGWQGHKIEQRWFNAIRGSFRIKLIKIDDWESPSVNLIADEFLLESKTLDVLHVPKGYISSIQGIEEDAKLLVMADYMAGEIADEYRFDLNYFDNKS